jgi:hypothetical protein
MNSINLIVIYLTVFLSIQLIWMQSLIPSLLKKLNVTPITINNNNSNMNYINQLLQINQDVQSQAAVAVEAFAESVSRCSVHVSCDEANSQYFEVESNLKDASAAYSKINSRSNLANSIINKSKNMINLIQSGLNSDLANLIQGTIATTVNNTGITLRATAQALTHCELIVNITCTQCSNGTHIKMEYNEANPLLDEIKKTLSMLS